MQPKQETGRLNIAESVLEKIAELVVQEIEGVSSLVPAPVTAKNLFFRSEKDKPIHLNVVGGVAQMDVYVVLKTGYKIKDVAETVQEYIKDAVQNMAAVTVSKVNVYVRGVVADSAEE